MKYRSGKEIRIGDVAQVVHLRKIIPFGFDEQFGRIFIVMGIGPCGVYPETPDWILFFPEELELIEREDGSKK